MSENKCISCGDIIPEGRWYCPSCEAQVKQTHKKESVSMINGHIDNEIDKVNHPQHYETGKFECIDVMVETQGKQAVLDFCLCNAFKYIYRHQRKNGLEDIKKAKWYIDKYIELWEKGVTE